VVRLLADNFEGEVNCMRAEIVEYPSFDRVETVPRDAGPSRDIEMQSEFKADRDAERTRSHQLPHTSVDRPEPSIEVDHQMRVVPGHELRELSRQQQRLFDKHRYSARVRVAPHVQMGGWR
jgi:hypothetical protein